MNKTALLPVLVLGFLAGLLGAYVGGKMAPQIAAQTAAKEDTYQRVLRTGEIRCGYGIFAPYFTKDAKTGAFGGIWYDYTEAVADHLGLKVIWAEEVGLSDVPVALDSNRIDMYCGALWTVGKRVRVIDYLQPSAFEPLVIWVRVDDRRFDEDVGKINDPGVSISAMDGSGEMLVATEDFPKAKAVSLPQLSNYADMFNQVVAHKADVTIAAPSGASVFIKNNPGTLRPILSKPLRISPVALAVKYGESRFRDMMNQAQQDVLYNGIMDKIIAKYEVNKGDFWRVAAPYAMPNPP